MMVKSIIVKDVFEVNTYFYIDEETGHGFIIDPGAQPELLLEYIKKNKWTIEKILITHGHFDHIGAVRQIQEELQIPYYINQNGKQYLEDTFWNLSSYCDRNVKLTGAEYLEDGQKLQLSNSKEKSLQVIATPGHTMDSVIFYSEAEQLAFVGDTVFRGSIGLTQYPGSNKNDIETSVFYKIFSLPESTILCSGHSDITTVGIEKRRYKGTLL